MKFPNDTVCTRHESALGPMVLAATANALVGVWFDGQAHQPDSSAWPEAPTHPVLQQAVEQLDEYLDGHRTRFELPLRLDGGTPFQQRVWQALLQIAPGSTCSYRDLSAAIDQPAAVRAVGGAVGRNPLSIIVPCHRVVGAQGALTGYAGGLARKAALLRIEGGL
jgi:methylated-DNA-[protein]-cysteine S-methyltransferase